MGTFTGVDVSAFQGHINWDELAQAVSFVIYKGTSAQGGLHVDPDFLENHAQARAHNIPRGIYHFAGGADATSEANYFYQKCATNLLPGEVVVLDAEWGNATNPAWCLTFLETLELLVDFKPMIYMNHALMMGADWAAVSGANYGLWLADWDGDPNVVVSMHDWTFCAIQQYTDTGKIAGVNGNVDVDAFFAHDMSVWNSYGKPDSVPAPTAPATPAPAPTPAPTPVVVNDPLPPTPVTSPTPPSPPVSTPPTVLQPPSSTPSLPTSNPPTPKPIVVTTESDVERWSDKIAYYYKGIVAFLTTAVAFATPYLSFVPKADQHWVAGAIGLLGSIGVVSVANKSKGAI